MFKNIKGIAATAAIAITTALAPVYEAAAAVVIIICDRSACLVIVIY